MNDPPNVISKGKCLILNYFEFNDGTLFGADKDAQKLEKTFGSFGFDTKVKKNLTCKKTLDFLESESKDTGNSKYDCLAVCVLSYGGENEFMCKDGKISVVNKIKPIFFADNCAGFAGKPKLFFIDACRGKAGKTVMGNAPRQATLIPNTMDILVFFSYYLATPEIDTVNPSWFTEELCQVLDKYGDKHKLDKCLTFVLSLVKSKLPGSGEKDCAFESSLCFDIQLKKK